jgi:hypothetical protein
MSKSGQPIALTDMPDGYNIWLIKLTHTWKNIEFVQAPLAQILSIKAIEQELHGFDGTNIEFVQQAAGQLPSIGAIERELMGVDGGDV